jgi:hypothetical protein
MSNQTGVTDTAGHRGACENCNAPLGPSDPCVVWYHQRQGELHYSVGYGAVRGCMACADDGWAEEVKSRPFSLRAALGVLSGKGPYLREAYCERCGRRIIFATQTKYPEPYRRIAYCSEACKEVRAAARQKTCEVCTGAFTATRRDAKTCSGACKQKAYRRRKAEAHSSARP